MEELIELGALGLLNANDMEDAILFHILNTKRKNPDIKSVRYGRFNIDNLLEKECELYFRFKKNDLTILKNALNLPDEIITPQRYSVSGLEGLCILLRRLVYPNRLADLEPLFGLSAEYLSVVSNVVMGKILENKGNKLKNLRNLNWLNENRIRIYAKAIADKECPLQNCWGFIDGTARPICRPSINQENYFSGHKRVHCVKYQSVLCPDGIIVSLLGPYEGGRHDAGILLDSNLYAQLEEVAVYNNEKFVLYGDPAYPQLELIKRPFQRRNATNEQQTFNSKMSTVRQAVEWGFGKVLSEFAFVDFKKNQKLLLQNVGSMYY